MENAVRDLASQVGLWLKWIDGSDFTSKSELPLVWRTRSSMLVDRRPYNDQNKDQTDQKVGERKRGKKKKDRVERTKDHQQRTKTELNCQCVIELRVFLYCLLCILSLKIELCMDHQR